MKKATILGAALSLAFITFAGAVDAKPSPHSIYVDGQKVSVAAYEIADNNYFKLRDIAKCVSGSGKQFEVSWDSAAKAINLTSNAPYTAVGGELGAIPVGAQDAKPSTAAVSKDGAPISYTGYEINGNNYYKLRDVAQSFDVGIKWDGANQRVDIITTESYETTPQPEPDTGKDDPIVQPTGETKTLSYRLAATDLEDQPYAGFKVEIYKAHRISYTTLPASKREYKVAEGITGADGTVTISWEVPADQYDVLRGNEQYLAVLPEQNIDSVNYRESVRWISIGADSEWGDRAWSLLVIPKNE